MLKKSIYITLFLVLPNLIALETHAQQPVELEKKVSQFEQIYHIKPASTELLERIRAIELKANGLEYKGSLEERLEQIDAAYKSHIDNCLQSLSPVDHTPVIDIPDKHSANPIIANYQPEYGNYYQAIKDSISRQGIIPADYHFKSFPVTYYIEPATPEQENQIRLSISQFDQIIPLKEISDANKANIKIYVAQTDQILSTGSNIDRPGLNKTTYRKVNNKVVDFSSDIYLNEKIFKYPMSIYSSSTINHEFLHALGLNGHSNSIYDILYPRRDVNVFYGAQVGLIVETCEVKDFELFGQLTLRDINTLWLLYNEWQD